ncbi:efflux RND transporter periplasmic adaptor subunit [Celerinatantimonas yamalensis]|uniref:Efflux RND transporter periplasmic adaptor subunit n=1 Tax=Celerinatantimonas yamalensis TaxID=559956 RepID=A0ABW9G534_9GAMM
MNQTTNTEEHPTKHISNQSRKRRRLLAMLAVLVVIILIGIFGYYQLYGRFYESTDDAYVQGNLNSISPQISGTVTQVFVEDGDYVKKGQTLVTLDQSDTRIALQSAEANLASVVRQTRGLYSDIANYQAQVQTKKIDYKQALADYERRQKLAKKGAVSVEEVNHYRDTMNAAKNALISTEQTLESKIALIDGVTVEHHPAIRSAIAKLQSAYLNHLHTTIKAPIDGYVAKRSVQVGEQVSPTDNLLVIVPLHQVWINANFKESQLKEMRIGQPVDITTDLYGDNVHYQGHVASLGIGTGSAFALLPAQNASGNWIKIVQRLPVRIAIDSNQSLANYPLRIGLSCYITVHLVDNHGPRLSVQHTDKPRFSTDIYDHPLNMAHKLVAKILSANGLDPKQTFNSNMDLSSHE